jgi:hypothetical protein
MMGEVERKTKKEVSFEFPPWDHVAYKDPTKKYKLGLSRS